MNTSANDLLISEMKKTYIIAEIGVNHDGDVELAKKLVDEALKAKVDAVKFQTFNADLLVTSIVPKAEYQERSKDKTQYEMLKNLELSKDDFIELNLYCCKKGIEFLSTPYDIPSIDFLSTQIGVKRIKIASADLINTPLLKAAADSQKEVILSGGMANLAEIEYAIDLMKKRGNCNLVLLHCVTSYPTLYENVNMNTMITMKNTFGLPTGYSDHTIGIEIPIMAVALGAQVIEKHFTLDRNKVGPDHFASLEPDELKVMVKSIRNVEKSFGTGVKQLSDEERSNIYYMRRSIHASKQIEKGSIITPDNIRILRPNEGIQPKFLELILGKQVKKTVLKNKPIKWDDLL